ncbi:proton-conducting membrane transporter [Rudanella paleaurantiibacter]|uniref:Proton-conducting membrane transporter n=1 Tax=Rudanella paleaurantiibacter TaxID=2614655 RepID=A0A7J5U0M4_9BACT|nr:proton-conducting transporter membrane subunit [Rudanella paleaurantiibacter]KAB7731177.1 proton-conducting membrane transporter [Rudanella paleaurantiibacter]
MAYLSQPLVLYVSLLALPIAGALVNGIGFRANPQRGAQATTAAIWASCLLAIAGLIFGDQYEGAAIFGIRADALSWIMATLILFVSGIVHQYSQRYMAGDRRYQAFFVQLSLLTAAALLMVMADHVLLLLAGWGLSNGLLVRLMIHKTGWRASYNAGMLALRMFFLGFLLLAFALILLADLSGSYSLRAILATGVDVSASPMTTVLILIMMAALIQSALLPFHKWLTSSLNSPTPVSALMHAGLINGGGFLLARFAPLYLHQNGLLLVLFGIGVLTALVGAIWKLIQSDIKRMLACSTMSQMGFMVMQCGLGLFPAAVAHLCWHGLFKAFLFLSVGSAVSEKRQLAAFRPGTPMQFVLACVAGLAGVVGFAYMSNKPLPIAGQPLDSTVVLLGFAFMAATQIAQTVLQTGKPLVRLVPALVLALLAGGLYGLSVHGIETVLAPLAIAEPQPLHGVHLLALSTMLLIWVGMNLNLLTELQNTRLWRSLYVAALNGSQPDANTTTPIRTTYHV